MVRACIAGEAPAEVVLDAINRRGKPIRCRVSCSPLVTPTKKREGAILIMEEVA
jgi:two-component system CheB/CheR fusion protein